MKKLIMLGLVATSATLVACSTPDSESGNAQGKQNKMPPADFVADAKQGQALFQDNCASCHGAGGKGSNQGPPLIHDIYRPDHHADMSFFRAVKDGSVQHHWHFGSMPPIANVSPEEVSHIIAYVRRQQRMNGIR